MGASDAVHCMIAFVAPYFYMLSFRAPFSLRLNMDRLSGLRATLCRAIWAMVITSGLLLAAAAFAFDHNWNLVAIAFVVCAVPFFALLFIPGMVAVGQNYGWDGKRRRRR